MMCLERNTLSQPSPADTAQEAWAVWGPKLTSQCGAPWVHGRMAVLFGALCAGTQVRKGVQGTPLWHLPVKSPGHSCGGSHCPGLNGALPIHGCALEPVTVTISGIRVKSSDVMPTQKTQPQGHGMPHGRVSVAVGLRSLCVSKELASRGSLCGIRRLTDRHLLTYDLSYRPFRS